MKKDGKTDRVSTFIGADASIDGAVEFKGTMRVDGRLKGKIVSSGGTVVVGENAAVNADINVNVAVVRGEVNGKIVARQRIEVYPPGRVIGDIQSPAISIEPGGVFDGNCLMKAAAEAAGEPAAFANKTPAHSKGDNAPNT